MNVSHRYCCVVSSGNAAAIFIRRDGQSGMPASLPRSQEMCQPFHLTPICRRSRHMPLVMVEITDIQVPAVKLINPPRGVDVVPAFGCIVLVAANQQKRPWRDQSQQLVLIRGVVHLLNEITEVPIVFIIRKRQADATLVTDDGSNPVIKCRSVTSHYRPELVTDNSDLH